jgi:hypothetical protein
VADDPKLPGIRPSGRTPRRRPESKPVANWWTIQRRAGNPFLPILLLAVAVLVLVGSKTSQLVAERSDLNAAWDGQVDAFEQSKRLRRQLDGIAAETVRLARRGNQNAAKVVGELSKLGITIDPDAKPAPIPE